jgi:hypothetical protein
MIYNNDKDFKNILLQNRYFEYQNLSSQNSINKCSDFSNVKGRLRDHYRFWEVTLKAPAFILDVIKNGYKIPFLEVPKSYFMKNNKSALKHSKFVSEAVAKLVSSGSVLKVSFVPYIVSPLSVAENSQGKKRLILDLSVLNKYVWKEHFKFEDWKVAYEYLYKDGFMFKFDITSAYHHIDISTTHQCFLGFSWSENNVKNYYVFTVLPFGLSPSPFIFTKCLRYIVKYIRENGVRLVLFLDDGWGVNRNYLLTLKDAEFVKSVLLQAGFVLNLQKSVLVPTQILEWLGIVWNLQENTISIPSRRLVSVVNLLHAYSVKIPFLTGREIARLTGKIVSMMPVIGNVCKLMTKNLHRAIESRSSWDSVLNISFFTGCFQELHFWENQFKETPVK